MSVVFWLSLGFAAGVVVAAVIVVFGMMVGIMILDAAAEEMATGTPMGALAAPKLGGAFAVAPNRHACPYFGLRPCGGPPSLPFGRSLGRPPPPIDWGRP